MHVMKPELGAQSCADGGELLSFTPNSEPRSSVTQTAELMVSNHDRYLKFIRCIEIDSKTSSSTLFLSAKSVECFAGRVPKVIRSQNCHQIVLGRQACILSGNSS